SEMRRSPIAANKRASEPADSILPPKHVLMAMTILILLLLSKNSYTAAFTSYYTFYLIAQFGVTVQVSQLMLFVYLVVGAAGVIIGGMVGGRIGRRRVIWVSVRGSLPFSLVLPLVGLFRTALLACSVVLVMVVRRR